MCNKRSAHNKGSGLRQSYLEACGYKVKRTHSVFSDRYCAYNTFTAARNRAAAYLQRLLFPSRQRLSDRDFTSVKSAARTEVRHVTRLAIG